MSRPLLSFILLILGTLLLCFWHSLGIHVLHFFSITYSFLMRSLQVLINDHWLRQVIVVILLPLLLALIPVFFYWIFRRRWLYEYMSIAWCIWLVLVTMIVMRQGMHV